MFKLVVLSCLLALATAGPTNLIGAYPYAAPTAYGYAAAAPLAAKIVAPTAYAAGYAGYAAPAAYAAAPAIAAPAAYAAPIAAPAAYAAPIAAPIAPVAPVAYAAPAAAIAYKPAVSYTAPQQIGTAVEKQVHIAPVPQVTGYSQSIMKPNLGLVATPPFQAAQFPTVAAGRKVQTIIPQETRVEPEIHVQRMPYDVPVPRPYAVPEIRTPVVQAPTPVLHEKVAVPGAPLVAPAKVAVHDVPTPVAAAPVVAAPAYPAYPAAPIAAAPIAARIAPAAYGTYGYGAGAYAAAPIAAAGYAHGAYAY